MMVKNNIILEKILPLELKNVIINTCTSLIGIKEVMKYYGR